MKCKLILIFALLFSFAAFGQAVKGKETLSLVGSASTAADTTGGFLIGNTEGSVTLFVDGTVNSGTATAVTITAEFQPAGESTNWYHEMGGTGNTVDVFEAADITADDEQFVVLADLSWWSWAEEVRFIATAASGTFNVDLILYVEGN